MQHQRNQILMAVVLSVFVLPAGLMAGDDVSPTEKIAKLKQDCAASAEVRAQRHADTPLYERLGQRPGIEAVVTETVRLHGENETIVHLMDGVNREHLVQQVTDFLASGTGGDVDYNGRDMHQAHAHLDINDAEFLAAGGDVAQAMRANGHGDAEIEEVTCMFMSLHDQVVAD